MTRARSPYMEWAKKRPKPEIDLAGSNLLACSLDDLPGARDVVDLAGESPNGYPPLVEAIASRYGVQPANVATAVGCSGANFLALAALIEPGDGVLLEKPGYDPLAAASTLLGATISRFERRFEEGYRLDRDAIAAAMTPRTRVVMLSSPHNPSGGLASSEDLRGIARLAERHGFHGIVDEVYLDLAPGGHPPAATLSPAFVSTNSLTKAYGLASLRCGWALASAEVTEKIRRARDVVDVPMVATRVRSSSGSSANAELRSCPAVSSTHRRTSGSRSGARPSRCGKASRRSPPVSKRSARPRPPAPRSPAMPPRRGALRSVSDRSTSAACICRRAMCASSTADRSRSVSRADSG